MEINVIPLTEVAIEELERTTILYASACDDALCYMQDLVVDLQNTMISDLFGGVKLGLRLLTGVQN